MMKSLVDVSTEIALTGLYITPDIWLYSKIADQPSLNDAIQRIIHDRQPNSQSYANFGDFLYEKYHELVASKPGAIYGEFLMAMGALIHSQWQCDIAADSIVDVAINIHMQTNNIVDTATYPRIIPHELESMRLATEERINRDAFRQILTAEPWRSWIEMMRGQLERGRAIFNTDLDMFTVLKEFDRPSTQPAPKPDPERRENAKRAIKRAVKLYERLFNIHDVRDLVKGNPVFIVGKQYNYGLTMERGHLFHHTLNRDTGMAPTHMSIRSKRGKLLGCMCLYYKDTAVVDHLLTVKLHASNEQSELAMLKSGHFGRATRAFYDDPILPDLKQIHDPVTAPLVTLTNIHENAVHDEDGRRSSMFGPLRIEARQAINDAIRYPKNYLNLMRDISRIDIERFIRHDPEVIRIADGRLNGDLFMP